MVRQCRSSSTSHCKLMEMPKRRSKYLQIARSVKIMTLSNSLTRVRQQLDRLFMWFSFFTFNVSKRLNITHGTTDVIVIN